MANMLEKVLDMWDTDSVIDALYLDDASIGAPKLSGKYLRIYASNNLRVKQLQTEYDEMRSLRLQYYEGKLNGTDTLAEKGWEPFLLVLPKVTIESSYLPADKELTKILLRKAMAQEVVDTCKFILKQLENRHWQIKEANVFRRMQLGG